MYHNGKVLFSLEERVEEGNVVVSPNYVDDANYSAEINGYFSARNCFWLEIVSIVYLNIILALFVLS